MGLLGISLLVASVVYVILRPPPWIPPQFILWKGLLPAATARRIADEAEAEGEKLAEGKRLRSDHQQVGRVRAEPGQASESHGEVSPAANRTTPLSSDGERNRVRRDAASAASAASAAMPPPPPPPPVIQLAPTIQSPTLAEPDLDEQTTPKAEPSNPSISVPTFSLSNVSAAPSPAPAASASMMPPPPAPGRLPPSGRLPSLAQFPAPNSAQRARGPAPNRGAPSASLGGGLAPPPSHSSIPAKPKRKVLLTPGHSPLDWARISGPNADLRGLPSSAPYLRVTPSMLKKQTGRKGKDAWMALNGKVYNITPYAEFHPGGVPELMRGAARDGTKLFGEIHPWVNYETMLSACMVGLLVEETEQSKMEDMD